MADLLVLGCSDRKLEGETPLPAICRYNGPVYQSFRHHLRSQLWPEDLDVAVLSAKFGMIGALTPIETYDVRMTRERADELAPAIAPIAEGWLARYDRIKICAGKTYVDALPEALTADAARTEIFDGGIGTKRNHLGNYLKSLKADLRKRADSSETGRLSYFLPDWDDLLDRNYDFTTDEFSGPKEVRDEIHCSRLMAPTRISDGILVSLAQSRESKGPLKFVGGLEPRTLRPLNLRTHYGLDHNQSLFGDCGAFSYVNEDRPPLTTEYAVSMYELYDFDYGASIDHIPVPSIRTDAGIIPLSQCKRRQRVDITVENAQAFIDEAKRRKAGFTPVGTVQGLNPSQYARNALAYAEMGYERIALGGLVPLRDPAIREIVSAVTTALRDNRRQPGIHLFGVFRPDLQSFFRECGISSFDSATYFRKAWLRSGQNYLACNGAWYAAIRVPMTRDGRTLKQLLATSELSQSELEALEARALIALHEYDRGKLSKSAALDAVMTYDAHLVRSSEEMSAMRQAYDRTLSDRPWDQCDCPMCVDAGINTLIFRGSNRNKRRGTHNTLQLYEAVRRGSGEP